MDRLSFNVINDTRYRVAETYRGYFSGNFQGYSSMQTYENVRERRRKRDGYPRREFKYFGVCRSARLVLRRSRKQEPGGRIKMKQREEEDGTKELSIRVGLMERN
jgi:hypothetical protein